MYLHLSEMVLVAATQEEVFNTTMIRPLVAQTVKSPPATWSPRFDPWVGKITWRQERQSNPVFLSGEFHGQRSLVGYSPWGRQESYMNEQLTFATYFHGICSSF